jgi:hypothetical protein
MAELLERKVEYTGPAIPEGMKSTVDEEDLEMLIIGARENIYSYVERTLVQEYVNNGKDANREAGNPDHMLDIHIPTREEPIFRCRDYGPGLSPEGMNRVFRKTAKSTKRENKNATGKYGVGAKIAFKYTDAFTVVSFHDGTKYTYLAHKANTKIGEFLLTETAPTTEKNGLLIEVALVKLDHISKFTDGIKRIFKYWKVKPKFNYSLSFPDFAYEDENMIVIQNSGVGIVVDGTPYKIELAEYDQANNKPLIRLLERWNNNVYFKAQLTEVEIPMNREYISNDDLIKKFFNGLTEKLQKAERVIVDKFLSKEYNTMEELRKAWENDVIPYVKAHGEYYVKKIDRVIECSLNRKYNLCLKPSDSTFRLYDRESKSKFIVTREIKYYCYYVDAFITSRLNRIFDKSNGVVFESEVALPDGFVEFFGIKTYDEAFPKSSGKSSGISYSRSTPLDKETFHYKTVRTDYSSVTARSINVGKWKAEHEDINIPIFYLPVVNNSYDSEYARVTQLLLSIEHGRKILVYGLSTRSLDMLRRMGYKLEEVPRALFQLTDKMKQVIRESAGSEVSSDTVWKVLEINIDKHKKCLDPDIVKFRDYIRKYSNNEDRWNIYRLSQENLVAGMKSTLTEAAQEVKAMAEVLEEKYPFLQFDADSSNNYRKVNEWLFSSLLPLLYPRSTGQSKLPQETTALN